jgi:hypothetical protein
MPVLLAMAFTAGLTGSSLSSVRAQEAASPVRIESSPQIFATMCALDAAGFDANSSTLDIYPAESALRAQMLQTKGPAVDEVRKFYAQHRFMDPDETLAPFLTFALVVGPPPNFAFRVSHENLPPEVLAIENFDEILGDFYTEQKLDAQWTAIQPDVNHEIDRLQGPVRGIVFQTTSYLREILEPSTVRTFTVYVDPLVGNRVNFRNIGDHYAIIVGPGTVLPLGDIRHAFLHFLLDPLTLKYQDAISTKRVLLAIAARAPQLPPTYQDDFVGLFDECLIRAVELRLRKLPPEQVEATLTANDRSGFILVRPIYEQLIKFEKAEPAMTFYFPDLVNGIDVSEELSRLQNFRFASTSEQISAGGIHGEDPAAIREAELNRELVRGDRQIAMKDGAGAAGTFQDILNRYPNLPRAVYGLAIASVLQGQGDRAEDLFEQLVRPTSAGIKPANVPGPEILAWSHVYLGRIYDLQGNRDEALEEYRAALAVNGGPDAARVAAQEGIKTPYRPAGTKSGSQ